MKRKLPFILIVLLGHSVMAFAQNKVGNSHEISYVDSAIHYCKISQNKNGIDTSTFEKAMEMVYRMDINLNSINRIEKISKDFRNQNRLAHSDRIMEVLIYKISDSDNLDLAIDYCKNIIEKYDVTRNPDQRLTALRALVELRKPLRQKNLSEAFDYYTSRLKVYLNKDDSSALSITYFCLGTTYRLTGLPDMTIYNIKKSLSYIDKSDTTTNIPISGLEGWMNNTSVLGQLYLDVGDYNSAILYSKAARDVRIKILKENNVSFLNCNIAIAKLKMNELGGVDKYLNSAIELASVYGDYPSLVRTLETKGQYFLAINQLDSAEACLLKCKEVMSLYDVEYFSSAGIHTPDYYLAKVRILQSRFKDARKLLEQEIEKVGSIKREVLKELHLLIEVYHKLGDTKAADSAFKKYSDLQAELSAEERKNRTKSFEIEAKIEDAENTINTLVTEKKIADITKKYLTGVAVLLLIVASIIFNRFRVTRRQKVIIEKEKDRSEELLLNILPAEIAEELKAKGSADAKSIDMVTVLFTDFKGFTALSEQLSPENLVSEINYCFSEFDLIMQKHGIEKIKTIGDAYMAAGGLPTANQSHPVDVVQAALEIRDFMVKLANQKRAAGELFFEIRIGVHTGPVVAGIVGVKKFAYDIWGDTVNTASRMESSGEVSQVNISGTTYELVKDTFKCTHRGKIQAKGKGELDMYFVEARI